MQWWRDAAPGRASAGAECGRPGSRQKLWSWCPRALKRSAGGLDELVSESRTTLDADGASGPEDAEANSAGPRTAGMRGAQRSGAGWCLLHQRCALECGIRVKTPGANPVTGTFAHRRNGKALVHDFLKIRSTIQTFLGG